MEKENLFKKHKTLFTILGTSLLTILVIFGVFELNLSNNNKTTTSGNKGMIVLKEEMVMNKIEKKDSFVLLTCNGSNSLCSDLYKKIEKSDLVDEYQIVFMDLYPYMESIKAADDDVQRKEYIDDINQLKSRFNIKKLPTIQTYKNGVLDKNKSDIYSNEYLKKNQEEQASELQDIINEIKMWLSK